jgi:hypothetical protein
MIERRRQRLNNEDEVWSRPRPRLKGGDAPPKEQDDEADLKTLDLMDDRDYGGASTGRCATPRGRQLDDRQARRAHAL